MSKNKKIPASKCNPKKQIKKDNIISEKRIYANTNPSKFGDMHPKWVFSRIDTEKWTIHDEFVNVILEKLISFEQMTWNEILAQTRNGKGSNTTSNHNIPVGSIIRDAQKRLEELHIVNDEIFSITLDNCKRIWGILDSGTLQIIWYDPCHEIYHVSKRHT